MSCTAGRTLWLLAVGWSAQPALLLLPRQVTAHSSILPSISGPKFLFTAVFLIRIRIGSGFNQVRIRIWNPDPDPGGQIWPTIIGKIKNFMFWSAECSLLRAEGFFCSFDVLYGGLGTGKLYFLIQIFFFSAVNFFQYLFIKTLDPDWIQRLQKCLDNIWIRLDL